MSARAETMVVLALALLGASLARVTSLAGLVVAWLAAWAVVSWVIVPRVGRAAPTRFAGPLLALAMVMPMAYLASVADEVAAREGWLGLGAWLADRHRLESTPSIAPHVVASDRPQTFFVHAPGARAARAQIGEGGAPAPTHGHGVLRVDNDPPAPRAPVIAEEVARVTLDVDGEETTRRIPAIAPAPHPRWPCVSVDRALAAFPLEESDAIALVGERGEARVVPVGDGPSACAFLDREHVVVALRHEGALEIVRVSDGAIATRLDVAAPAVAVSVQGDRVACVAEDPAPALVIAQWRAGVLVELSRVTLDAPATHVHLAGDLALVATRAPASLRAIALDARRELARRALVTPVVAWLADRERLVVAVTDWTDDGHAHTGNHYVLDQLVTLDASTLAVLDQRATATRSPRQDAAGAIDRGVSPMGLSLARDGSLLVAFAGTDEVWRIGPRGAPRVLDVARFGLSAPHAAVELAEGSLLVSSPSSGLVSRIAPGRERADALRLAPGDDELLRASEAAALRRWGERAVDEATRAGVSCQSCHLHGGSDGARHNIGGGLLAATLDVRGIGGTPPYLRDGSYPRLRDLHEVSVSVLRGHRVGGGDRARMLEAFLERAPPRASTARFDARDVERERAGLDAFFRAGCPRCHAPPAFTSLGRWAARAVFEAAPEGTLFDVPSLLGVGASAPYLHDGRAATLDDVLEESGARHGHVGALYDRSRADLVSFLEALR